MPFDKALVVLAALIFGSASESAFEQLELELVLAPELE